LTALSLLHSLALEADEGASELNGTNDMKIRPRLLGLLLTLAITVQASPASAATTDPFTLSLTNLATGAGTLPFSFPRFDRSLGSLQSVIISWDISAWCPPPSLTSPLGRATLMQQPDIIKYCDLMEEIKRRTAVINAFGCGGAVALYKATTIESVYLQFRKIIELIALGSRVANKNEFSKVYGDFAKCWNAQYLLRDIQRVNPDFYPCPIVEVPSKLPGAKMEWQDKKDGFLTKDDFLKLYEKCGAIMHAGNPYGSQVDYGYYERNIQAWLDKITGLLNSHTIRLANDPNLYLLHMKEDRDDKVHHYVFAPVPASKPSA
jgi:hypothetical protein